MTERQRWALAPGLRYRDWGEPLGVVYAPDSGATHLCDATALAIIELLSSGEPLADVQLMQALEPRLADELDTGHEHGSSPCFADVSLAEWVRSALSDMARQGLIVSISEPAQEP